MCLHLLAATKITYMSVLCSKMKFNALDLRCFKKQSSNYHQSVRNIA